MKFPFTIKGRVASGVVIVKDVFPLKPYAGNADNCPIVRPETRVFTLVKLELVANKSQNVARAELTGNANMCQFTNTSVKVPAVRETANDPLLPGVTENER